MLCSAETSTGQPCRSHAVKGGTLCSSHLGRSHRPSKALDESVTSNLLLMLRAGNYLGVAARAAGVSRQQLYAWLARGESGKPEDELYRELREQVEQARAEGEARNVAQIATAATENWQAAAWLLERQYPERWGRPSARVRASDETPDETPELPDDPFSEVDELAERRRSRA